MMKGLQADSSSPLYHQLMQRISADIERGTVNMRIETILRICSVLHITPDEILTEENASLSMRQAEIWERLNACNPKDRQTALSRLSVFLESLGDGPEKTLQG